MKFSLVLASVGRTWELERFLAHLDMQSHRAFELILVDQNPDDRLVPLIAPYGDRFPVIRCKSSIGLSRARNVGLVHASGDILVFPDDDCWYTGDILERVASLFRANPELDCIAGRSSDPAALGFDGESGFVDRRNVFRRGISYTIFVRERAVKRVGGFDESLGLGTTSGKIALEETDYLIRVLSASFKIFYFADLLVSHGGSGVVYDRALIRRQYGSALALGYVLRKHKYSSWFVLYLCLRPLVAACLSSLTFRWPKARYHHAAFLGRLRGWLSHT